MNVALLLRHGILSLTGGLFEARKGGAQMRELPLTEAAKAELEAVARHHAKPYMRTKASALLLVNRGIPAAVVARNYLVPRRDPDTLYSWIDKYLEGGVEALIVQPGRGRKPAFSPPAANR
jgi:hypothetical protein